MSSGKTWVLQVQKKDAPRESVVHVLSSKMDALSLLVSYLSVPAMAVISSVQCGFCIPGMVMAAYYLLENNPNPSEEEIRMGISGNICRCTGYDLIVDSIALAAKKGEELWKK